MSDACAMCGTEEIKMYHESGHGPGVCYRCFSILAMAQYNESRGMESQRAFEMAKQVAIEIEHLTRDKYMALDTMRNAGILGTEAV